MQVFGQSRAGHNRRQLIAEVLTPAEFCAGVTHGAEALWLAECGDTHWRLNDQPLVTYGGGHVPSGGPTQLLTSFLDNLRRHPSGAVLDVAGGTNARALQDLHELGLAATGLVTNYRDRRAAETRALPWLGHVGGDLINPATWDRIGVWKETYAPEGFAGVLHEPISALQHLPRSFYLGAIHTLIDWTRSDGALLVRVPRGVVDKDSYLSIKRRPDVAAVRINSPLASQALIVKS